LLDGTEFDNSITRGSPMGFPVTAVIELPPTTAGAK
jgi:FKBP-type peptidyl-prolyl cis-trans isomerase